MRKILYLASIVLLGTTVHGPNVFAFDSSLSLEDYRQTVTVKIGNDFTKTLDAAALKKLAHIQTIVAKNTSYANSIASVSLCPFSYNGCLAFSPLNAPSQYTTTHEFFILDDTIHQFISQFSQEFNIESQPMTFTEGKGKLISFRPGNDGRKLSILEGTSMLSKSIRRSLTEHIDITAEIPYEKIPRDTPEVAKKLGIVSLIGSGTSNFSGSPANRIFNIRRALEQFQGQLIAPGEEFSFTTILGPVEEETGYRPELVIRNNKTEPEYGGGICQVSTTLFRAAVLTGLEITERHNHSYPVTYYRPTGFDATVYVPRPDLQFVNNTARTILLYSKIEGTQLTFEIYGTPDGRTVKVTDPVVTKREDDGSLSTVFTQTVAASDGTLLIQNRFQSHYDNPDNYPHPEDIIYTEKPKDWSKREWREYKKTHEME